MHEHIQKIVDQRYLELCAPQAAYEWLRDLPPLRGFYRNRFSDSGAKDEHENVLLDRDDPLIDYALARYGRSGEVATKLYSRLSPADRRVMRACHFAGGGPSEFNTGSGTSPDQMNEMEVWVVNPNIGDEAFSDLFNRRGVFEKATDDQWQTLLAWAGMNPRLSTPYESIFMDGYDEYTYCKTFHEAWLLTKSVPTTQSWAGTLNALLENMVADSHDLDINAALERWQIDEEGKASSPWYSQSQSWYLRSHISGLLPADKSLVSSPDVAVRASFYQRFNPRLYSEWPDFAKRDGDIFFNYAMNNELLWRSEDDRQKLSDIAWDLPDKHSTMDAPNSLKAVESRMRRNHPEWFDLE